jgi:hypothetical protein
MLVAHNTYSAFLAVAHELYEALLGPVEALVKD